TAPAKPALPAVPAPPAKAPPPASVSPADFTPYFGKIDDTTLRQVARELVNSKRSGVLVVRTPPDAGSVHFLQGNIAHADYRGLRGQDAFCKLLDAQHGSFELQPLSGSKERTITLDTEAMLAECDSRRVQARALKKRLGSARQVFVLAELSKEQHAWLRPIDHQLV